MPELAGRVRGREKKIQMGRRALEKMDEWIATNSIEPHGTALQSAVAVG